jgi:ankyrin repeat protein/beta-lactamase regulating signal transducer with metallopeptidase domain
MTSMWISSAVLERLAGSLLHFVWQGAAIAIVTAVALRLLRRRSAEYRYAAALVGLAAMLVAPFVTFTFYAETGALALRLLHGMNGEVRVATPQAMAGDIALWTQRIVGVWMIGVIVFLARLIGGWLLSRRLVRSATAVVTPVMKEALELARAGLNFHGAVRLLCGERIESPIVIGWLRPAILLPVSALTGLSAGQLLAILSHELAHIRRHDFLVNGIQRAVECVLFYHPAVWWVSRRIRVERELCCDDLAVGVCGDRLIYVQALVALEKARSAEPVLALPTAGVGVKDRVRRILGVRSGNRDWQSAAAALVFAMILVGAGMWQPPVLAASAVAPVLPAPQQVLQPPVSTPTSVPAASLNAIIAIATGQNVRPSTAQVTQPPIAPSREAARDRLGMLRVEYSADSFVKQAGEGDTIAIKTFLAAGMNINARNEEGSTGLMQAATNGQTETVQSLLAAGANPNLTNKNKSSALMLAAYKGDVPTMKVLIAGGADVNLVGSNGETALIWAAAYGQRDAAVLLLDNKASIEAKGTGTARTALIAAACGGHFDAARTLVDRGADANASSSQTALGCAAQRGNAEAIQFLLDKGADINATSSAMPGQSSSPLHLVLETNVGAPGNLDKTAASALLLISRGANVNATYSEYGTTPLDLAAEKGLVEVVRALLDKGANPNKGSARTPSPLLVALSGNSPKVDIAMLLIDRGADVNAMGFVGGSNMTPLILAVRSNQVGVVRALLAKGADPNLSNKNSIGPPTPLSAASGSPEMMQLLIQAGAKQ